MYYQRKDISNLSKHSPAIHLQAKTGVWK